MILKRIRGVLGVAAMWACTWGVVGSAWSSAQMWLVLRSNPAFKNFSVLDTLPWMFVVWAILGGLSGAVFAGLLMWLERRRSVDELSTRRVAIWGALGGASLPLVAIATGLIGGRVPSDWLYAPILSGALGAMCATMSLRLATRTSPMEHAAA